MGLIKGYEDGANILLLNTIYAKPHKDIDSGKWTNGTLFLVYRDLDTFEKKVEIIKNPTIDTYVTKPEYRHNTRTQRKFMPINKLDKYTVPYNKIINFLYSKIKEDGTDTPYLKIYADAIEQGNYKEKNELLKWRYSYYADANIQDYYQTQWFLHYKPKKYYITKSYLDIECDVYGKSPDTLDEATAPINCVTYIVDHEPDGKPTKNPYVFTFLLRDHIRYTQQEYFENHLKEFKKQCHHDFDKKFGECKYKIFMYDNELDLLQHLFGLIHLTKSDFLMIFNMSFDVRYIARRLQVLGADPLSFFVHPDFKDDPYMYYYEDYMYKSDMKKNCDYFDCTSYSKVMCQMRSYA